MRSTIANISQICKVKRRCPFHNHNSNIPVANPISNLPADYLATAEQKDRMVEILERSFRNDWTASIEEIKYATSVEGGAVAAGENVPGAAAGLIDHSGQGNEGAKSNSAPAAMQTLGSELGEPTHAPYSAPFGEAFDDSPYSFHGFAFEHQ